MEEIPTHRKSNRKQKTQSQSQSLYQTLDNRQNQIMKVFYKVNQAQYSIKEESRKKTSLTKRQNKSKKAILNDNKDNLKFYQISNRVSNKLIFIKDRDAKSR